MRNSDEDQKTGEDRAKMIRRKEKRKIRREVVRKTNTDEETDSG